MVNSMQTTYRHHLARLGDKKIFTFTNERICVYPDNKHVLGHKEILC